MPKKKTGARKKAEKQKTRQKDIRSSEREITECPGNFVMVINVAKFINLLITF